MGFTINGSGIRFYGQRDFRADGSYLTTEWVVFFWVPLIPLRSLRVAPAERTESYLFVVSSSSENYAVYETRPRCWKQVLYTYGYVAIVAGWPVALASLFPRALDTVPGLSLLVVMCALPTPLPLILRYYAQRKLGA